MKNILFIQCKKLVFSLFIAILLFFVGCGYSNTFGLVHVDDGGDGVIDTLAVLLESKDAWSRNFNIFTNDPYQFMQGFMYEPLVIFDSFNNNKETMWLAEDVISEPDNKTLTIKVRQGIKWSDGEDFNAEDVAFTFLYSKEYREIDRAGDWGENGLIEEVKIIDDYTLQLVMREENRFHRNMLYLRLIAPEHIYSKIDNPSTFILLDPVVTGAFSVVEIFKPEVVSLGRNPNYWNTKELHVDRLVVPQYNSNDAALALIQMGNVDWAHIFIPNIERIYIKKDPHRKYWYGMHDAVRLAPNYMTKNEAARKAFENVDFKCAMSLCVDRKGIIDSAVFGYLSDTIPTVTGLPPALYGYRNPEADAITEQYTKYNVAEAKRILAEAGFKDLNGDGYVQHPDGTDISFEVVSPSGWTDWNTGAVIAVQGMQEAGINAKAITRELAMFPDAWSNGDYDVRYSAYSVVADIFKFYYDTIGNQSLIKTPTWWTTTQHNYANDKLTDLINKLPLAKTDEEFRKITDEVELFYAQNMINIPILHNGNWFVYNDSRFSGWATKENPFVNPANCYHDTKILQLLALRPIRN